MQVVYRILFYLFYVVTIPLTILIFLTSIYGSQSFYRELLILIFLLPWIIYLHKNYSFLKYRALVKENNSLYLIKNNGEKEFFVDDDNLRVSTTFGWMGNLPTGRGIVLHSDKKSLKLLHFEVSNYAELCKIYKQAIYINRSIAKDSPETKKGRNIAFIGYILIVVLGVYGYLRMVSEMFANNQWNYFWLLTGLLLFLIIVPLLIFLFLRPKSKNYKL